MTPVFPAPVQSAAASVRLVAHTSGRGRLHFRAGSDRQPPVGDLVATAVSLGAGGCWWVAGGEPGLRPDLDELVEALLEAGAPSLGLATDGHALAGRAPSVALLRRGLARVAVQLPSADAAAAAFVTGVETALRDAVRAARRAVAAGIPLVGEVVLTRPTVAQLPRTVELLARLGAAEVVVRRLVARQVGAGDLLCLAPRLLAVARALPAATATARRHGARLLTAGLPPCVTGYGVAAATPLDGEVVIGPLEDGRLVPLADETVPCPNRGSCPVCPGAPADHVAAFGWEELLLLGRGLAGQARGRRGVEPTARGGTAVLAVAGPSRVACAACAEPAAAAPEPLRDVRRRLLKLVATGPLEVRVVGPSLLHHPGLGDLVADLERLRLPGLEVVTDGAALRELDAKTRQRLLRAARILVPLFGPDGARHDDHAGAAGSFAATLEGCALAEGVQGGRDVGCFAVLHDEHRVEELDRAWRSGSIPGPPRFRLSPVGGSLLALAQAVGALPEGGARDALLRLVPPCLGGRSGGSLRQGTGPVTWGPSGHGWAGAVGSDAYGDFVDCPHAAACAAAAACPGLAAGWSSRGVAPVAEGWAG